MSATTLTLPLRLESAANERLHWRARMERTRRHRRLAGMAIRKGLPLPAVVTLTRIAPRQFDDDNLAFAFKALRDGVADAFGVADNHPDLQWRYAQRKGDPRQYAVEIHIEPSRA